MYLIITRSFPPEIGGMQSLMWGLSRELSKNFMIKVFADYIENHNIFDEQASFSIERVSGIKLLRKYRKAQLINEFIKENKIKVNGELWVSGVPFKFELSRFVKHYAREITYSEWRKTLKDLGAKKTNIDRILNRYKNKFKKAD